MLSDKHKTSRMGASVTTSEIFQQPDLWQETLEIVQSQISELTNYIDNIDSENEGVRIIFTGAGTSAYVGETIVPYLLNATKYTGSVESIPTTDLVSNPKQYLVKNKKTLLVSFARSGNSPESLAAVELATKHIDNLWKLTVTCNPDGELAKFSENDSRNYLLLMPEKSNDAGFAMTGSFTCMLLSSLLIFDHSNWEEKERFVTEIIKEGNCLLGDNARLSGLYQLSHRRIVYLGSGSLQGIARESQLKILELTAGAVATLYDTCLGFRHGPKSFVDEETAIFVFVSNDEDTRKYDSDILRELYSDELANQVIAIQVGQYKTFHGERVMLSDSLNGIPDVYLGLIYVIVGQVISVSAALKLGNTPDTPSPSGTVNRVVQGVKIYR